MQVQFSIPSLWPGPATHLTGAHRGQQPLGAHLVLLHAPAVLDVALLVGDDVQRSHVEDRVVPCSYSGGNGREGGRPWDRTTPRGPRPTPRAVLPLVSPQPAISHLVPGGTTYCSGGKQIRATRWFRVTGLRQKRGRSGPAAERPGPTSLPQTRHTPLQLEQKQLGVGGPAHHFGHWDPLQAWLLGLRVLEHGAQPHLIAHERLVAGGQAAQSGLTVRCPRPSCWLAWGRRLGGR